MIHIPIDPDMTNEHALLAFRRFPLQVTAMVLAAFAIGCVIGSWWT